MRGDAPVVIVRKRRSHHGGHHGGAWKVAYADFVTAMMAFFLVMWLVSQSPQVRQNVAGYFRDPGVFDHARSTGVLGGGATGVEPGQTPEVARDNPDPAALAREREALAAAAERIRAELTRQPGIADLRDQIEFTITAEGLRIELVERAGSSFFDSGSAVLRGESVRILVIIAAQLGLLSNDVVIEGHTDRRPYSNSERYGNWELSADRANSARREMERAGLKPGQIRTVRGFADTSLHLAADPLDPRNRRVSIVVRSQAAVALERAIHDSR